MARIILYCALLLLFAMPAALLTQKTGTEDPPAASGRQTGVGFKSVADALAALKARPGAKLSVTQPDAWTIITEAGGSVVWSFTPSTHPAYPAVVRRAIVIGEDGMARIEMTGLCQAEKAACDKLMKQFQEVTEKSTRALRERMKNGDETKQP
jgi:hypothetical protein